MKILWLDINSSFSHSSLAIPALDAQLDEGLRSKVEWKVVSGTIKMESNYFVGEIERFSPTLILSTVWLFNHNMVLETLTKVSALLPQVKIVLGGPQFLGENSSFLNAHPFVDAVFRGEGEEIFPLFINRLLQKGFNEAIELSGFCNINEQGEYIDQGVATVSNFKELRWPESSALFNWDKPFIQLETSRGCFNRCTFCVSGNARAISELEPSIVKERINRAVEQGIKEFRILDRTFNANSKRAKELLEIFSQYGGEVEFHLEIHPALIDHRIEQALQNVPFGTLHLEVGIQSFREEVLVACRRSGNLEATLKGLISLCNNGRFEVHTDLLIALPKYSYSELVEDVVSMFKIYPHEIQLESLKILPGTALRTEYLKYGIKYNPLPPYQVLESSDISFSEIVRGEVLSTIIEHYYNPWHWRELFRRAVIEEPLFLEKLVDYYLKNEVKKTIGAEKRAYNLWKFISKFYPSLVNDVAIRWMELGLSFKVGAALLSNSWKPDDPIYNPIYTKEKGSAIRYRYLEFKGSRHWFQYDRGGGTPRATLHYIELF